MNDAMTKQVGGSHYKGMKIEPFEFGHANCYDPETFSIMKYVSRHRSKGGAEDLRKSLHIIDIKVAMIEKWGNPPAARDAIPVGAFVNENGIQTLDGTVLGLLHVWALYPEAKAPGFYAAPLRAAITHLLRASYPKES